MCGIAGIVSGRIEDLRSSLAHMRDAISHRGPDGHGEFIQPGCGLLHTRLSIVDLAGGHQPMVSHDGRYAVTFNGEIYGFRQLRVGLDYEFRTQSDTEVILALYRRHGPDMLSRLPGMFAFAIWDNVERTLFCARDRFGEKPFFYAQSREGDFLFASEVKALLASGLVDDGIELESVSHYLRKLYVHPHSSIFRQVRPLRPGHSLLLRDGRTSVRRYWSYPRTAEGITPDDAREELTTKLEEAVDRQLVADVPIGAFLSGGLDSSTVVAAASKRVPQVTTLCYRIEGELDESEYARSVADLYSTRHIEMAEDRRDLPELLQAMASVYDEPFADSSNIPTWLICRQARQHCKVVLTGDGADELFGGYVEKYRGLLHMLGKRSRPRLANLADLAVSRVLARMSGADAWKLRAKGAGLALRTHTMAEALDSAYGFFDAADLASHGLPVSTRPADEGMHLDGSLNDAFKLDMDDYMAGDILVKTDRASMANGIELRAPFLDRDLAEFVISLPARMKIDMKGDKKLLREAYSRQWPRKVRTRAKQGFGAPVERWLATPAVRELTMSHLHRGSRLCSLIDPDLVVRYREGSSYRTWILLTLALWLERWQGTPNTAAS